MFWVTINPLNDRMKYVNIYIIQIYAPTSTADEVIVKFYEYLHEMIAEISYSNVLYVMGDCNKTVGIKRRTK